MTWQSLGGSHNPVFYERPHVIATQQELPVWETLGQHSSKTGETNTKTREQQHFNSLPGRVNIDGLTGKSQLILLFGEGISGTEEVPSQVSKHTGLTKHYKEVSWQIFLGSGAGRLICTMALFMNKGIPEPVCSL